MRYSLCLLLPLLLLTACDKPAPLSAADTQSPEPTSQSGTPTGVARDESPEQKAAREQNTFPAQQRAPDDPVLISQGLDIYSVNCRACHGEDLRGGDLGGPNLLRSDLVLKDLAGELIGAVVLEGRSGGDVAMPALQLDATEVKAVAAYIHSVAATARGQGAPPPGSDGPQNILVGNKIAGGAAFQQLCSSCHALDGALANLTERYPDPVELQNTWVAGGSRSSPGHAVSVNLTLNTGESITGTLVRRDDFFISLNSSTGAYRSFTLGGSNPQVSSYSVNDPMARHIELLGEMSDETIHDITAYLMELK